MVMQRERSITGLPLSLHALPHTLNPNDFPAGSTPAEREIIHTLRHVYEETRLLRQYFRRPYSLEVPGEAARVIAVGQEVPLLRQVLTDLNWAGAIIGANFVIAAPAAQAAPACDIIFELDGNRLDLAVDDVVLNTVNMAIVPSLIVTRNSGLALGTWALRFNPGTPLGLEWEGKVEISFRNRDAVALTLAWGILAKRFTDIES